MLMWVIALVAAVEGDGAGLVIRVNGEGLVGIKEG